MKEALKLALEALECLKRDFDADQFEWGIADEAITAIKEALAQPEQEPVAVRDAREWEKVDMREHAEGNLGIGTAPPPKRTWVDLTEKEVDDIAFNSGDESSAILVALDKFKEKNT